MPISSVLSQPALVLNKSWCAITTTTVRHALELLFKDAAQAVRPETYEPLGFASWSAQPVSPQDPCVATVTLRIRAPEVILLTRYNGFPQLRVAFSRKNLDRRDRHTCQYCGHRPGSPELSIDHVVPRSRGGRATWDNCVLACLACNRRKGDRLPEEAGMRLLRPPVRPGWTPVGDVPVDHQRPAWRQFLRGARPRDIAS